jgi:hypothetical protein
MKKAWVVTVDMGYGHQRATYPLADMAYERIITANSDQVVSAKEKRLWHRSQNFYEGISRLTSLPLIGRFIFKIYDKFQAIPYYYSSLDLSYPDFPTLYLDYFIRKNKLTRSLMEYVKRKELPFVTTHFIPALGAEHSGIKKVFCIVTDTDITRAWISKDSKHTKITYLAPCEHTVTRLKKYGVPDNKIILTGFPLPKENLGGADLRVLKKDLGYRLPNLDPKRKYLSVYEKVIKAKLGGYYKKKSNHKLTLTFMIGGAGAQKDIGLKMLVSLKNRILAGDIRINFVAGTRLEVAEYYRSNINQLGLAHRLGKNLQIVFAWNKQTYFKNFNYILHTTDILWTKPSELSFYTALGIPIIIAPPIGAHEFYNEKWLLSMGSGFPQEKPEYTEAWLYDWLEEGKLAEAALEGFLEAPNRGTYNIEKVVFSRKNL